MSLDLGTLVTIALALFGAIGALFKIILAGTERRIVDMAADVRSTVAQLGQHSALHQVHEVRLAKLEADHVRLWDKLEDLTNPRGRVRGDDE
jgi:hypothetical protein